MAGKETLVLASASSSIRTWSITLPSSNSSETSHKRLTVSIPAKDSKAVQLSWSADGSELAVAMLGAGVQIQNARGQAVDVVAGGGRDEVNQVAFMGGRRYVVFAGSGKVVKMFDREKHSLGILLRAKAAITALGVSADDKRCAAGTESGEIIVHSIGHGTSTTLTSPFKEAVNQIVFSSNRKSYMYAISDDGTVAQWDVDKKRDPLQIWRNVHKGPVRGLALPSATTMCTVGLDKMLNIYDLSTNRVVQTFNANTGLTSCSVAEDHIYALGSISGSLLIYDAQKNETIAQMKSPTDTGPIHAVTFQPTKSNKPSTVSSVKMPSNATVTRPTTPPDRKTTSTEADHAKRISEVVEGPISKSRVTAMQHNEFMGMFSPVAASTKPVAERTRVSAATMAQTKSSSAAAPPPQPARGQRVADVRRSVVAGQPRSHHGSADKLAPSGGRMEHARTRIVSQPRTETHAIERTRATVTTTSISRRKFENRSVRRLRHWNLIPRLRWKSYTCWVVPHIMIQ
ncbi:WD40-repeat-containing domain protein [Powellomyces hirtus]|nr:WD40-repeat-containing domain protein [Powellomyces hirtus]